METEFSKAKRYIPGYVLAQQIEKEQAHKARVRRYTALIILGLVAGVMFGLAL